MRPRHLLLILSCALISIPPVWAVELPYSGIVNRDGAPARSGPGEEFYATDALRRGDQVEVYRVDEGGWCAIRPPAGSFSLVLEQQVHMTDTPGLAEVAHDGVLAYVGSRIRKRRDAVQVVLNRGEFVEIVGMDELPQEDSDQLQTWYRIAPPAGEFRWIHLEYVDRQDKSTRPSAEMAASPVDTTGRETARDTALRVPAEKGLAPASSPVAAEEQKPRVAAEEKRSEPGTPIRALLAKQWKPLPAGTLNKRWERVARANHEPTGGFVVKEHASANGGAGATAATNVSAETPPGLLGHVDTKPVPAVSASPIPGQVAPPSAIAMVSGSEGVNDGDAELDRLDVEFSLMVSKPVTEWQLEPLMLRANRIAQQATAPATHDRARALVERMREFHFLQNRRAPLGAAFGPAAANGSPGTAVPPARPSAASVRLTNAAARGPANPSSTGGLPALLTALESLMPPRPGQPAGVPTGVSARPLATSRSAATSPPTVTTVSVQSPATAPPDPAVMATLPLTADSAAADSAAAGGAAWRAAGTGAAAVDVMQPPTGGSAGVLDRIKDTILYPLGAGPVAAETNGPASPTYDGQGWLVPVVSRHGRRSAQSEYMPPFVLTDQEGNILQFITPAPGVNLHRYMGKEIGVFGQQRPLEHLSDPHVTASRIVMLDRHRR